MYALHVQIGSSQKTYAYLSPIAVGLGEKVLINLAGHDKVVTVVDCEPASNLGNPPYEFKYISGVLARPDQIIPSATTPVPSDISADLDSILARLGFTKLETDLQEIGVPSYTAYYHSGLKQGFNFKDIEKVAYTLANFYYRKGWADCEKEIS